jgi:multidrug resistance efflux pump
MSLRRYSGDTGLVAHWRRLSLLLGDAIRACLHSLAAGGTRARYGCAAVLYRIIEGRALDDRALVRAAWFGCRHAGDGRSSDPFKFEEAESAAVAARDRVTVLQQKVARTLATLGGDINIGTEQNGLVREKRATRDRAALDLSQTVIRSPVNGIAVNVKLMVGEQAKAATTLFAIVADGDAWIEANFKETDLTHVRPGHGAAVTFDIYGEQTFKAVVESISPATGAEFAILPPQNASGNWVKVVQRLPVRLRLLPSSNLPVLRAGMTASVAIDTGRERRIATLTTWRRANAAQLGAASK